MSLELDVVGPDSIPDRRPARSWLIFATSTRRTFNWRLRHSRAGTSRPTIFVARSFTRIPVRPMRFLHSLQQEGHASGL